MKTSAAWKILLVSLGLVLVVPARAQDAAWSNLIGQVQINFQQQQLAQSKTVRMAENALRVAEQSFESNDPRLAETLEMLGTLYMSQGEPAEAAPIYRKALSVRQRSAGDNHPLVADVLLLLRDAYYSQGRPDDAWLHHQRAVSIRKSNFGDTHPLIAEALNVPSKRQFRLNQVAFNKETALQAGRSTLLSRESPQRLPTRQEAPLGPVEQRLLSMAKALSNRAEAYAIIGEVRKAEKLFKQAVQVYENHDWTYHPELAKTLLLYSAMLEKTGRKSEGEALKQRAQAIHVR